QSPARPEAAEAALRWGQALKDDGLQKMDAARKRLAPPNLKPEEAAAASKALEDGIKEVRAAVQYLEQQAERLRQQQPKSDIRVRMHYEAAWGCRALAETEVAAVRGKLQAELWQKLKDQAARKTPPGRTPPVVPRPEIPLKQVPLQPSEQQARAQYQAAF